MGISENQHGKWGTTYPNPNPKQLQLGYKDKDGRVSVGKGAGRLPRWDETQGAGLMIR